MNPTAIVLYFVGVVSLTALAVYLVSRVRPSWIESEDNGTWEYIADRYKGVDRG